MPIEPGVLCERELPCDARFELKLWRRDDAREAAALGRAGDVDELADRERRGAESSRRP